MDGVLVPPAYRWVPTHAVSSTGDLAADIATRIGIDPDPEQCLAIDAMCAVDRHHQWAAFESCIIEGRQNGKTEGVVLPVVADEFFFGQPDRIVWTAHRLRTARGAFLALKNAIEADADLSGLTKKINDSHGSHEELSIELRNGSLLEFLARSRGVGRGLGGKLIVFDEALYLDAAAMGALLPTLSARRNTRVLYASSAGVATSDHLRTLRDRGRRGGDPSLVYIEWGGDIGKGECRFGDECPHYYGTPGCKLDDESLWPGANHAMARDRITYEHVRNERRALPPLEFARERAGWWDAPATGERPIKEEDWLPLAKSRKRPPRSAVPVFFIHVSPDSAVSAIGVAYYVRNRPHVGLVEYKPGTSWLADRAEKLDEKYPEAAWAVEDAGTVGTELPALKEVGIEPVGFSAREMGRACGHLQQLVKDAAFTHSGNPAFTMSVKGSGRRPVGEGLWVFSAASSSVDTTPLMTAAGALWKLETREDDEDFAIAI